MIWPFRSQPEAKAVGLTTGDPARLAEIFGVQTTAAGVPVGEAGAMKQSASRACIRLLTETVATLPVHCYRKSPDGSRDRASDHPAERLLSGDVSPWMTSAELRREMMFRVMLDGVAYARAIRVRGGEVRELQPIGKGVVTRTTDPRTGEPSFKLSLANGGTETVGFRDMIEVRALGGRSPVTDAAEAIGFALVLERHGSELFSKGGRPSGFLKVAGKLSAEAAKRIRESWEAMHGGSQSGRTAVLEEGVDFSAATMASTDAQHAENRKLQVEDIARHFGIPPVLIGEFARATWANAEQSNRQFLTFGLLPWLSIWTDALSRVLLTPEERETHFLEFETAGLVRADLSTRFEGYAKASGAPWMTPNETRRRENMPPVAGGDVLRVPMNTEPAGDAANA